MDYTKILTRSFEVVWKNRALWLFGILLALFGGGGGWGGGFPGGVPSPGGRGGNVPPIAPSIPPRFDFGAIVPILVAIACIIVLLALLGIVLRFVSRGALIGLVNELEGNQTAPTIRRGFGIGFSRFWSLLGIAILVNLPLALLALLLLALAALPFLVALLARAGAESNESLVLGGMSSLLLLICAILFLALIELVIKPFYEFMQRACVIGKRGAMDSVREGFRSVRANLGNVVVLYILVIAVGIGFGIAMIPVALVLIAILAGVGFAAYAIANSVLSAIIAVLVIAIPMILLLIFVSGLYRAYESTLWTEGYLAVVNK